MKVKKEKKVKLASTPKIRRKLLKLWGEAVRERDNNTCCYCGVKKGDVSKFNADNTVILDSHHLLQKEIHNCILKFCTKNGCALCKSCHKYGFPSAHKAQIIFYDWFRQKYPERHAYILKYASLKIDLDNRKVLEEIELRLTNKEPLDLDKLLEIEKTYPRVINTKPELKGNLFEQVDETKAN